MEEYLSLYHIYTEYKYLLDEESQKKVDEYLRYRLNTVVNNTVLIRDMDMFISDLPYLLKTGMEREAVKKLAFYFYNHAENSYLASKEFLMALFLRKYKSWIDIL